MLWLSLSEGCCNFWCILFPKFCWPCLNCEKVGIVKHLAQLCINITALLFHAFSISTGSTAMRQYVIVWHDSKRWFRGDPKIAHGSGTLEMSWSYWLKHNITDYCLWADPSACFVKKFRVFSIVFLCLQFEAQPSQVPFTSFHRFQSFSLFAFVCFVSFACAMMPCRALCFR